MNQASFDTLWRDCAARERAMAHVVGPAVKYRFSKEGLYHRRLRANRSVGPSIGVQMRTRVSAGWLTLSSPSKTRGWRRGQAASLLPPPLPPLPLL